MFLVIWKNLFKSLSITLGANGIQKSLTLIFLLITFNISAFLGSAKIDPLPNT